MFAPAASAPPLAWLLAPAAVGFLWLAGHLATRAFPSPCRSATSVLTGLLILFFASLACDTLGLRITLAPLALALALVALLGLLFSRHTTTPRPVLPAPCQLLRELWWAAPCALATASVLARGIFDPLAGWDNLWRWNHLALVLHDTGSLAAYPPVSAADFLVYPWCDGIPPLVAVSNLWIYLVSGSTAGGLIVFRLALELLLTGLLTWRIARDFWGPLGARFAVLALAGSSLFLASVSIAQETSLGGLGVLTVAAAALAYRRAPSRSTAVWLGVAAAFAALCRDYNLLYLPVALSLLLLLRAPRRDLLAATAAMLLLTAPWYVRNALHTGNPLFAHSLGGLFPGNAYHDYLMAEIRRFWAPAITPGFSSSLFSTLTFGLGPLAVAALASLRRPSLIPVLLLSLPALATVALWLLSIPSTAGGVVYSLRTLGPLSPLLAVAAGAWALRPHAARIIVAALLATASIDAARRHWIFLLNPLAPPLPYTWQAWTPVADIHQRFSREKLWPALAASAGGEGIAADNPGYTVLGARQGIAITPLASPALSAATQPATDADAESIRLAFLAAGIRFLVLGEDTTFGRELHSRHPGLGLLYVLPPAGVFEGMRIYDLRLLTLPPARPAPEPRPSGP